MKGKAGDHKGRPYKYNVAVGGGRLFTASSVPFIINVGCQNLAYLLSG